MASSSPVSSLLDAWVADGREPGGAVCVVREGEPVVDHVAGTRDGVRPWEPDTLVMTYSVAKPFAALTVLDVVASGGLSLETRVAELWPEYAARGKEGTTVRHVLSHGAGLPCFPEAAASLAFDDEARLTGLLADAAPDHAPGDAVAEHALTYGHLCAALVRAATGEDLADRFARIAAEHGWDLHLRVADSDLGRVADVVALDGWPEVYADDPRWGPALGRPPGLLDPDVLNSARFRGCSFPAIAMHASARGLARFYADLMAPGGPVEQRLGRELNAAYVGPAASGHDRILDREVTWTLGFQVDDEDIGMGGAGGCSAWWSFRGRYAAAYVSRGLGDHTRGDEIWSAIEAV
ncbi:beta-lactamase family protein [Nocardioides sp. HDW12B]|uniref:serine hydrolase domain-containing protein n=1 Tax=Nocardioides sp. HDW12B TaxID=2714939 RepID=UPI0014086C7C|nr:serine hydrolase domain-containing protein [Nocardioides sp. HDW12B]QIK67282.1 beta-lactamase family protein [Nocardioides sp. HDW12B]